MGSPFGAQRARVAGIVHTLIQIAIHKIRDHFDRALDAELIERLLAQVV